MRSKKVLARVATCSLSLLLIISSLSGIALAQSSRISGTVMDSAGAVVPNADVVIKNNETGAEFKLKSKEDGSFVLPSLPLAIYTVTASAPGFKTTTVTGVKVVAADTVIVEVKLEPGAASESVTVTGGAEVLQKESTTIGATITGRQISELPFAQRNALDLVLNLPGTSTPGRPRTSSINGLPQGSLNITIDGLNVQDNLIRSGDGFFTYIRPSSDSVAEVTVSTATPGAESGGEGAVQIKFVTKSGTNQYHGNVFGETRQPGFNANYYFNNLNKLDRTPTRLDQYGFAVGGPLTPWLKDRVFFFVNYERYRLPESQLRSPVVMTPELASGIFRYKKADGSIASVNLFQLAATKCPAGVTCQTTVDPNIGARLADMVASFQNGTFKADSTDPNLAQLSFINQGGQNRYYTVARFDFNLSSKQHLETIWNYNAFRNVSDFLNSVDPVLPKPFPQIFGGQQSNRFSLSTALRSQLSATVVNEARFGFDGGTVTFCSSGCSPGDFSAFNGYAYVLPGTYNNFYNNFTRAGSWRNTPVKQFSDTVNWSKDKHSFTFGGNYTHINAWSNAPPNIPTVTFGIAGDDPINVGPNALFSATNFPGASSANLAAAAGDYAFLVGRVTNIANAAPLEEATGKYRLGGNLTTRNRAREWGVFVQDFYKFRPNLTVNYGLRYEYAVPFEHLNGVYSFADYNSLFGASGPGNLFKPGVSSGAVISTNPFTKFTSSTQAYNADKNNFAPSIGIAWTPNVKGGLMGKLFGEDKTVIRGGYSIAYNRESLSFLTQLPGGNPGPQLSLGLNAGGNFASGTVILRDGLPVPVTPAPPVYPLKFNPANGSDILAAIDPNIKIPYTQSWSFGIQRELDKNTVFEARYVGNHAIGIWRRETPNEVNIFENGFLAEFKNAQNNLAIAKAANPASNNYGNQGLAGQVALPIFQASFGSATSTQFSNATNALRIQQGQAGLVANTLATNVTFQTNRTTAGLPANLFVVNPGAISGSAATSAIAVVNGGSSTYQGLQLELRRRLSSGLLVQGSYTFSKSLTNDFFALSNQNGNDQPRTLRDPSQDRGISPYDTRHALKLNYIFELPFGSGHRFNYTGKGSRIVDLLIGGWASHGIVRWNSGRAVLLTSGRGTFNQFESGVLLVGMNASDLQKAVKIRQQPADGLVGTVAFLPDDIIQNTLKAFGVIAGTPTGRYIAPPTTPGQLGARIFLRSPTFFRADLSAVKKFRIRENMNFEFRAEFLDAFNNINFLIGSPNTVAIAGSNTSSVAGNNAGFGRTNQAYQDLSTTSDPGGRLIQLVARFNF